ncbi:hypothetical protein CB0101_11505 [Synechococcus sp. CB0101]|jgi:hypothetical protein|uniref:hypothetical protein n=1 Tax=Synechococcus sp. CB0101 TaxID=232348 RepID=UPI00030E6375|nr:hypothetical protein [Synechococcus sp. CB0101]QCH15466.1 hypothetical protein CB0101_11505 [Synechococcus sp. CB0101]
MTKKENPDHNPQTLNLTNEELEAATGGAGELGELLNEYFKEHGIDPHSEEYRKEVEESLKQKRGAGSQTVFS